MNVDFKVRNFKFCYFIQAPKNKKRKKTPESTFNVGKKANKTSLAGHENVCCFISQIFVHEHSFHPKKNKRRKR